MSRPLRIEFPGATYHVTSRGACREAIFSDDDDRMRPLEVLASAAERFEAVVLAFCLMGNHYHLVLRTHRPNISQVMRHINGVYTQAFNRRHGKVGHVFQGRFKAVLVDQDAYLMMVCRYVEWNPVRAGLVSEPLEWPWSSARMHLGLAATPIWLDSAALFGQVLGRDALLPADWQEARKRYATLLQQGRDHALWTALRQQIYLGDEAFVARMQAQAAGGVGLSLKAVGEPMAGAATFNPQIPRAQRRPPRSLEDWMQAEPSREHAFWRAHVEGGWSQTTIGQAAGLSVSRVSRIISQYRARLAAEMTEDHNGLG